MLYKDKLVNINDNGIAFFTHSVKITDNIEQTDEGFLICKNATFARSGYQNYLGRELKNADLGIDLKDKEVYKVYRDEKDVFNEVSRESANGKYLTINHPNIDVTPENYSKLGKGHILGTPIRDGDNLVGDLFVSDPLAIELILTKKYRELSMGYKTKLVNDNGIIKQTNILYNHIALLERGRAGNARINDNEIENMEDKNMDVNELLEKITNGSGNTINITIGDVKKVEDEKEVKKEDETHKKDEKKEEVKVEVKEKDKETKTDEDEEDDKDKKVDEKKEAKEEDKKEEKEVEDKKMNKESKVNDAMFGGINQVNNRVDTSNPNNTSFNGNELMSVLQSIHDSVTPNRLARDFETDKQREQHINKMKMYEAKDFIKEGGF